MTVIRSQRAESEVEFLHTARELQIYTIKKCVSFPKRYTFYMSQPIAESATHVHEWVKMANSIYPVKDKDGSYNAHEVQMRRDYFLQANAQLNSMVSQIEVAHELFGLEPNVMKCWMDLVEKEIRLVKAVLKKDRERYKTVT